LRALSHRVTFAPILMFHYIRVDRNPYDYLGIRLSVAPSTFSSEMALLHRYGYHTITLTQLADHIRYGRPLPRKRVVLTFDDGYEDQYKHALPVLRRYGFRATFFIVSGFVNRPRYMTWRQIKQLDRDGMEIGVHTVSHLDLTTLPTRFLWHQIYGAKLAIEWHLRHPVRVFAYPSGAFDGAVLADVRRAGFIAAASTLPGTLHAERTLLYLYRVRILNSDTPQTMYSYLLDRFGNPWEPTPYVP